jgi:hypothetical protein
VISSHEKTAAPALSATFELEKLHAPSVTPTLDRDRMVP